MKKIEKYFLRPRDSFTNEGVVSQILVSCINAVHMSVVIYDAFRFLFATPVRLLVVVVVALRNINYHTHMTSRIKDSL